MQSLVRISGTQLLRKIHANRNHGMTFSQITKWYCEMKGFEYDLYETVRVNGRSVYSRVHRGVTTPTLTRLRSNKHITKFGNRYMLTSEGIRRLQKSGY